MDGFIVFACGCLIGTGVVRLVQSVSRALRGRCCENCRYCRRDFCPSKADIKQR